MSPSDIPMVKAHFIALWMEAMLFGINTVLFLTCLYVLLPSRERSRRKVFLATAIVMYTLCTAHVLVNFIRGIKAFFGSEQGPLDYYGQAGLWSNLFKQALHITNILIADSLLIYRLYLLWECTHWIVVLPILLLTGFSVSGYMSTWILARMPSGQSAFDTAVPTLSTVGYAFSLSTNVLVTGLIAGRIWWNARQLSNLLQVGKTNERGYYNRAITIIVESGAIFSASILILVVLYSLEFEPETVYVSDSIAQITGIVPTLIIVRVGVGCSMDSDRNQSNDRVETGLSSIRFAADGTTNALERDRGA